MPKGVYKRKTKAVSTLVQKDEHQLSDEEVAKIRRATELFDAIRVLERYGIIDQATSVALIKRVLTQ